MLSTVYRPLKRQRKSRSQRGPCSASAARGPGDEKNDLLGVDRFVVFQAAGRIAANAAQQIAQLVANDVSADELVIQAVIGEVEGVEEMPERPVPHVVQQPGQAHQRFDVAATGQLGANLPQAVHQGGRRPAGQVHGPEGMLEAGVLGGRIDPPGGLQLVDLPQTLHPGIVDHSLLGDFALGQSDGRTEGDVPVDRVVAEAFVLKITHGRRRPAPAGRMSVLCAAAGRCVHEAGQGGTAKNFSRKGEKTRKKAQKEVRPAPQPSLPLSFFLPCASRLCVRPHSERTVLRQSPHPDPLSEGEGDLVGRCPFPANFLEPANSIRLP